MGKIGKGNRTRVIRRNGRLGLEPQHLANGDRGRALRDDRGDVYTVFHFDNGFGPLLSWWWSSHAGWLDEIWRHGRWLNRCCRI